LLESSFNSRADRLFERTDEEEVPFRMGKGLSVLPPIQEKTLTMGAIK
jgi:hypothetical protein